MAWTGQNKSSGTWSEANKSSASWSSLNKTLTNSFLLLENGSYILLEIGDKIILEQSVPSYQSWSSQNKS